MPSSVRLLVTTAGCLSLLFTHAWAQSPAQTATPKWTFEVYGGGVHEAQSSAGTPIGPFPIGSTFLAEGGGDSRMHSSWRFGDGAVLLNDTATALGQNARITPLDDLLRTSGARTGARAMFGIRLGRTISPRTTLEVMLERGNGGLQASDATRTGLAAANETFKLAFTDLLVTAPVTALEVTSVVRTKRQSQSQTRIMGAVTRTLSQGTRWTVTGTVGAGIQTLGDRADEIIMDGRYAFRLFGVAPFAERDELTITYRDAPSTVVGLLGVGATFAATAETGIRLGVRLHLTENTAATTVSTAPDVTITTAQGIFLPTLSNPAVQFSNQAMPFSSLRPALATTLTTFDGSGLNRQLIITLGIVRRF